MIIKASAIDDIDVIPTGLFIDSLIGSYGIPKKRIVEILGEPGGGKSTLCLQIVADAQKQGEKCLWVDAEGTFTPLYAKNLGVDMERLDVLREQNAEDILNQVYMFIEDETYDLIIIDSIGELTPRAFHEKEIGERVIGGQATIVGQFSRKVAIAFSAKNKNVALIGINQLRITDLMTGKKEAKGGNSWNFHKAVSILVKKKPGVYLKVGEKIVGFVATAEVREKNKMFGNVGTKVDVQFIYNEGFSKSADLVQEALDKGIFEKRANSYYLHEEKIAVGAAKLRDWAKEHSEQLQELLTPLNK